MNVVYDLFDLNIVDSRGDRCGRVDDVLVNPEGRVVALVSGRGAKSQLLGRTAHRISLTLHRWLGMTGPIEPVVIPWERVRSHGTHIRLDGPADEFGLDALNKAAARRFVGHIPGAGGGAV